MEKPGYYKIGVLHQKCEKILHKRIRAIQEYPELVDAILAYDGDYTDESVCEIVTNAAFNTPRENPLRRKFFNLARGINKDVYGEVPEKLLRIDAMASAYSDLSFLIDILSPLSWASRDLLLHSAIYLREVRKDGNVHSIEDAYRVFESVFFRLARRGDKNSKSPREKARFLAYRDIAGEFSDKVFGDPNEWIARFSNKYSE